MGAHVSEAPHQQTLRDTPIATRFNVSAFGCLGYELDLKELTFAQRREVKSQIAFYKRYRRVMQYGVFYRGEEHKPNQRLWQCVDEDTGTAIGGLFQMQENAAETFDRLRLMGLERERRYKLATKPQPYALRRFGGLVKHALPVELNPNGFLFSVLNSVKSLDDCVETYRGTGEALMHGVLLSNQFIGSGYNPHIRLLGDYGSNLYVIQADTTLLPTSQAV
jgi:alpha-galactosidase